jgi:lipopolysaccharide transport system permease protein
MVGVIEGFRWALLGKARGLGWELMISLAVVTVLLIGGLYYFRRMEKTFADIL